jgi:hypothetical protein
VLCATVGHWMCSARRSATGCALRDGRSLDVLCATVGHWMCSARRSAIDVLCATVFLCERDVVAMGADGTHDVQPSPFSNLSVVRPILAGGVIEDPVLVLQLTDRLTNHRKRIEPPKRALVANNWWRLMLSTSDADSMDS